MTAATRSLFWVFSVVLARLPRVPLVAALTHRLRSENNLLLALTARIAEKNQPLGAPPPPPPEPPDEELDELLLLLELEDELLEEEELPDDDELEELPASVTVTGELTTSLPDALPLIATVYSPAFALCMLGTA